MDIETSGSEYLARSGAYIYEIKRERRDSGWTIAYCLLAALTVFWGIAVFVHTDPNADVYTNGFWQLSSDCDVNAYRSYLASMPPTEDVPASELNLTFAQVFNKLVAIWMPITALLAVLGSWAYLLLFKKFAKAMVRITIIWSVGSAFALAIVCFVTGAFPFGVVLLIIAGLTALFFWWIRDQLAMCAELLAIAGRGLNENATLVPASLGIKVAGLCVLTYSVAGFACALNIGTPARSGKVALIEPQDDPAVAICFDAYGYPTDCCGVDVAGWAGAYAFFCLVFMSWTAMLIMQLKLYTVADTIAQWYFAAAGSSAAVGSATGTPGSVKLAFRNCMTNSFGSVAFAAAILALLRVVRRMMERMARNNVICCILNCIVQPLLAMAEKFTRFATIATAITGQAFVPAAQTVFDTLKRNFLATYSLWWVPDMVLQTAVVLMSLTWAGIVFFATYLAAKGPLGDGGDAWAAAFLVALVAWLCMFYVLLFMAGLLLDVVNTLYICYAMDKDARRVTHPELHAVFNEVPTIKGQVIQNPDGAFMYGAPMQQQQAPPPPPYPGVAPQPMYAAGYAPVGQQPQGGGYQA